MSKIYTEFRVKCGKATNVFKLDKDVFDKLIEDKWIFRIRRNTTGYDYLTMYRIVGPVTYTATVSRYLLNAPKEYVVDHINGDTTDNRLVNLRLATPTQNQWNRTKSLKKKFYSKYIGVTWFKRTKKWQVKCNNIYLGRFDDEIQVAKAYDTAARKIYGEFGKLNFPNSNEEVFAVKRKVKTSK